MLGQAVKPIRILVLCTHNSARSQMAEGWLRHLAAERGVPLEVHSAGIEKTQVKAEAIQVMAELGIDISTHRSKTLVEVPHAWNFDIVVTVCDAAAEACPTYPAHTHRLHISFPDPTGQPLDRWREVRDALGKLAEAVIGNLAQNRLPDNEELQQIVVLREGR